MVAFARGVDGDFLKRKLLRLGNKKIVKNQAFLVEGGFLRLAFAILRYI